MKYKGKKGVLEKLRANKKKIAQLLLVGSLVLGAPQIANIGDDEPYRPTLSEQLRMEEEVPEPEYVNEYGIEITKEQYDELQKRKAVKKQQSRDDDWER